MGIFYINQLTEYGSAKGTKKVGKTVILFKFY